MRKSDAPEALLAAASAMKPMTRSDVTELVVMARLKKGLTWAKIAKAVGQSKEWATAALLGQMQMTKDQAETDYYWNALIAGGGMERPCGWLTDKFGVYWQVIPEITLRLMGDSDREKADRARQAMYGMKKIVIADLERAFAGRA